MIPYKIWGKRVVSLVALIMLLLTSVVYSDVTTKADIEKLIEKISRDRGVPEVLVKAIATLETRMSQFDNNGKPLFSSCNNVGIMQVGNKNGTYDDYKLRYDIEYNINAGIDILLAKWGASVLNKSISSVGNMDPNVLENWYFALWAYNGWSKSNNPNTNSRAYQNRILDICKKTFNQNVSVIDYSMLPQYGYPSRGLTVKTPNNSNTAGIIQYKKDDLVVLNSIVDNKFIRDSIGGKRSFDISVGQTAKIVEGPKFDKGTYWYKLFINDKVSGWIERSWIKKIGDVANGIYPFDDIVYHWAVTPIVKLYNRGIISGNMTKSFLPNKIITRKNFYSMFSKTLGLELVDKDYELKYDDKGKIDNWLESNIKVLSENDLVLVEENKLNLSAQMTRGQIAKLLSRYIVSVEKSRYYNEIKDSDELVEFDISKRLKLDEVKLEYNDISDLSEDELQAVKIVYSQSIIFGKTKQMYDFNEKLSRGHVAAIMYKVVKYLENQEI